jgi:Mg2+ and Co2+ transporter CorA
MLESVFFHKQQSDLSNWLLYSFINSVTDQAHLVVERLITESEELDELVLSFSSSDRADLLRRIGFSRRENAMMRQNLQSKSKLIKMIIKERPLDRQTRLYFRDVSDKVSSLNDDLKTIKELISTLDSTYMVAICVHICIRIHVCAEENRQKSVSRLPKQQIE